MINEIKMFLENKVATTLGEEKVEWQELLDMYTNEDKKKEFESQRG